MATASSVSPGGSSTGGPPTGSSPPRGSPPAGSPPGSSSLYGFLNNIETLICEVLLAGFVLLLFAQIIARQVFGYSIAWSEELSVYMFVWFAYLGAVVACKMAAHNRVTFHFKFMPKAMARGFMIFADLLWVAFNVYFIYLSYDFTFNKMNVFWKSQTLGVPMKYFYMILPIAFTLMTIRILWNLYLTAIKGVDLIDPETAELERLKAEATAGRGA